VDVPRRVVTLDDGREFSYDLFTPAMRAILALLVLGPLIAAVFIYHADRMIPLHHFQPDRVQYLALNDTD
jgi:hypothetical protein